MFDLTGKNALITGASGGIGGDIARALYDAGATVGLSGTRVEPLQALADSLGDRAHVLPCNLSDPEAVEALPKQAAEAMGSVDILVNNAGITRDNLFMRMSDEEWQSVIDVNLTATAKLCKGVLRGLRDHPRDQRRIRQRQYHRMLNTIGHVSDDLFIEKAMLSADADQNIRLGIFDHISKLDGTFVFLLPTGNF